MEKQADYIKKGIADLLELPRDIVLDLPKVTMIGNLQLYIENHKGIIEYSAKLIRINTKSGILVVTGDNLVIKAIVAEEIIITGEIEKIEYVH